MTNVIPMGEVWERVVSQVSDRGCCAFAGKACDLCRGRMGLKTGDQIYLRGSEGKFIEVETELAQARFDDRGDWQRFTIEKDQEGNISSGDHIYLRAHTGKHLEVENEVAQARFDDRGDWQRFQIINKAQHGFIYKGDTVYLWTHTGNYIDVRDEKVRARYNEQGDWQALVVWQDNYNPEVNQEQRDNQKKVCYKDQCKGTRTNPLPRGQQWIRTGQASDKGCCAWGRNACDWCAPPNTEESVGEDHCAELEAKYPECDDDYEGDTPCEPSEEDMDYYTENCEDESVPCESHADCGEDSPFCYDGECDQCDQCENCWDGIDGTCGPCGATTSGDTCKKLSKKSVSQSISETYSLSNVVLLLALFGLGSVLYGFYQSFVKVPDYYELSDVAEPTFKA